MEYVKNGGNAKLKEFLEIYNLNEEPIKDKYNSKASEYYRRRLGAISNLHEFHEKTPSLEEGKLINDSGRV